MVGTPTWSASHASGGAPIGIIAKVSPAPIAACLRPRPVTGTASLAFVSPEQSGHFPQEGFLDDLDHQRDDPRIYQLLSLPLRFSPLLTADVSPLGGTRAGSASRSRALPTL